MHKQLIAKDICYKALHNTSSQLLRENDQDILIDDSLL